MKDVTKKLCKFKKLLVVTVASVARTVKLSPEQEKANPFYDLGGQPYNAVNPIKMQ